MLGLPRSCSSFRLRSCQAAHALIPKIRPQLAAPKALAQLIAGLRGTELTDLDLGVDVELSLLLTDRRAQDLPSPEGPAPGAWKSWRPQTLDLGRYATRHW